MNNKLMTIAAIGIAFAGLGTTDTKAMLSRRLTASERPGWESHRPHRHVECVREPEACREALCPALADNSPHRARA